MSTVALTPCALIELLKNPASSLPDLTIGATPNAFPQDVVTPTMSTT